MRKLLTAVLILTALGCSDAGTQESSACDKTVERTSYECVVGEAKTLADKEVLSAGEAHIRSWLKGEPHLAAAWCHSMMHELGHHWVDRGGEVQDVFDAPYSCAGGLLHGSYTAWAETRDDITELSLLCEELDDSNEVVMLWDCWHGLGHAIGAEVSDTNDLDMGCRGIDDVWQEACVSGVFSAVGERMTSGSDHGGMHNPLESDPEWCQKTTGSYYGLCWERQGIMSVRDQSFLCPAGGLGAVQCSYGQGRGQGQVLKEGGLWDRDWLSQTNSYCRQTVMPDRCFDGVVYETVLHGEGRANEDVCLFLESDLGACMRESGRRRSFEIQDPTEWIKR